MIIQTLPDDRLLCIRQTTHALLAHSFCRHWGNDEFARPEPYDAVMLGIVQHDNGWYEWEECPRLDSDGRPIDFLHGPTAGEKRALWMRSVDRTRAQHPYAGLLVALHAAMLYEDNRASTPEDERAETADFLRTLRAMPDQVRRMWQDDNVYGPAMCEKRLLANTYLLKFGDNASLQLCVPWETEGVLTHCPVDGEDVYTDITIRIHGSDSDDAYDGVIGFDPWPFDVQEFGVGVHGRLLERNRYDSEQAYQLAMRRAPLRRLAWLVTRYS